MKIQNHETLQKLIDLGLQQQNLHQLLVILEPHQL
jgi:hypothetical protein